MDVLRLKMETNFEVNWQAAIISKSCPDQAKAVASTLYRAASSTTYTHNKISKLLGDVLKRHVKILAWYFNKMFPIEVMRQATNLIFRLSYRNFPINLKKHYYPWTISHSCDLEYVGYVSTGNLSQKFEETDYNWARNMSNDSVAGP